MITARMKKAVAAGVIGLTALSATAIVPSIADAQDADTPTQEEREANRAERQANRAERKAERLALLSDVLGVSADELQAAREDGQSLADIAANQGVLVDSIVAAIVDAKTAHIQEHVAAGDLTQAEADERIAGLEERVTERVNRTPGERGEGRRGHGRHRLGGAAADEAPAA